VTVRIRPLLPADVPAAHTCSYATFAVLDESLGEPVPDDNEDLRRRGEARVAHLQRTDPDGAWAAVEGDRLVGLSLASRRGPLWFLSLLVVEPTLQGRGTGRLLLDAALRTAEDAAALLVCSSEDPRALRRYGLAGLDLVPTYRARGTVDRARLPAVSGVREGSFVDDAALVDALAVLVRGAPVGPDLAASAGVPGARLLVADGPAGRGYAVVRGSSVRPLAATTPEAARALLVTGLAALEDEVTVDFVSGEQQWAVRLLLELRLPLTSADSLAVRGFAPAGPYLPDGAYG
jgi:GNAT superfamily N-acetyltransferase